MRFFSPFVASLFASMMEGLLIAFVWYVRNATIKNKPGVLTPWRFSVSSELKNEAPGRQRERRMPIACPDVLRP
jgi:hypothetical protein